MRVRPPFRLDLTVNALRRLPGNIVDVLTPGGLYVRVLEGGYGPVILRVRQSAPDALAVEIEGETGDRADVVGRLRRTLGTDRDLAPFYHASQTTPWLRGLADRMLGVKPPRYPSLWEAVVNAVVFQQVSLGAASMIVRRMVLALGSLVESRGTTFYVFPSNTRFLCAKDGALRGLGLSAAKLATLRRVARALDSGDWDAARLERMPTAEASAVLQRIKGIGSWTASVVLLRGLGRLDVFPPGDTGVARNLRLFAGRDVDLSTLVETLRPQQGMLYYHLLLAGLEARGGLDLASSSTD